MKNIKRLLVATIGLLSVGSMANLQPAKPVCEDAPIRIMGGINAGMMSVSTPSTTEPDKRGIRASNLSGGISFAHNVGSDFEYGLGVKFGWEGRHFGIFNDAGKNFSGMRVDGEVMLRFMPELAERLHFGGILGVGYGHQFGEFTKKPAEMVNFGDLAFKAGLGLSYGFTDTVAMYVAPAFAMTEIRFLTKDAPQAMKDGSNLAGAEIPLGLWVCVGDNVGLFLDVNTKFLNFSKFTDSWKEELTLGLAFSI